MCVSIRWTYTWLNFVCLSEIERSHSLHTHRSILADKKPAGWNCLPAIAAGPVGVDVPVSAIMSWPRPPSTSGGQQMVKAGRCQDFRAPEITYRLFFKAASTSGHISNLGSVELLLFISIFYYWKFIILTTSWISKPIRHFGFGLLLKSCSNEMYHVLPAQESHCTIFLSGA